MRTAPHRWYRVAFIKILLAASCFVQQHALANPPTVRIPRVSRPPKIEDFLNGTPRDAEAVITNFFQYEPGDGIPVSQPTSAHLSYDSQNLYIVFVCKDEPAKIRARMAKREDIESDDRVSVTLDTFHDRRRAYSFAANPLGIQADGIFTAGQRLDNSFDTLWHSNGVLTADGYAVWIAIPFKSLRFPRAPVQDWGIALGRVIKRQNESAHWPHITQRVESMLQQFATLDGMERISPGRNLQFIPYGILHQSRYLDQQLPSFNNSTDTRMGLDAKIVVRDAMTLDLALNPDFSQVESDEPQVTVNQRFEVFFPEKRPFFIENAGYFQTPINLFFSRRIADPQYGLRFTGKAGRWAIGALGIDDRAPGERVVSTDLLRDERAGIGVARIQREFSNQSTLGVLVTSCDFASSSNRVFSIDTRLKLNPNWVFSGQIAQSDTRQLDGTRLTGPSYWAELSHTGRHLLYASRYLDHSPDFRSELGFIPRVDIRKMEHFGRYYWKPERSRVLAVGPDVTVMVNWDRRGQVQDWVVDASFGADLKGPIGMGCRHVNAYELFQGIGFRKHKTDCGINAAWLRWLEVSGDYGWGSAVNYFPGCGLTPFLAGDTSATFGFTWRPGPRFRLNETYLYDRLGTRDGSGLAAAPPGTGIFNNHILRTKLNYQFTRELSVRAILDYNAVLPNSGLIALERAKRLTADFLVTYLINPGTALFVGYSDVHENLALVATMPPRLGRTESPVTSTGRQFFVKLSYLFRF